MSVKILWKQYMCCFSIILLTLKFPVVTDTYNNSIYSDYRSRKTRVTS